MNPLIIDLARLLRPEIADFVMLVISSRSGGRWPWALA
jgi:hypothetical protein